MSFNMLKRPKPGEDEEDILRMQEEFSKTKNMQPAAQVVNLRPKDNISIKRPVDHGAAPRKPSKYAQTKGLKDYYETSKQSTGSVMGDILEKNLDNTEESIGPLDVDDNVYYPEIKMSVMGEIIEKNIEDSIISEFKSMPAQGFPVAIRRNLNISDKQNKHSQIFESTNSSSNMDVDISTDVPNNTRSESNIANLPSKSYILKGKDAAAIHRENIDVLAKMSETEILHEQRNISANIDPKLIEFIRSRRKQYCAPQTSYETKNKEESTEIMDTHDPSPSVVETYENDSVWDNDVLSHPNVHKWVHFDSLEKDKLEWMKGVAESNKMDSDQPYEARFDFRGYLLPYSLEYTERTKTLFHHGLEPHRPGYSITELFELTRSSVSQQRIVALNTLAGVLEYHSVGTYKDVIEIPLSKIFFVIRIAMDENKSTILEPALKAMRNLVYNRIDEASLDALIGFEEGMQQPSLEIDKLEINELDSEESELKDFHLAEIDLISALLRTDILQRLYYILEMIKPSFMCVQYSLQILVRLARDSTETANKIVYSTNIMNVIMKYFVPATSLNFMFTPLIVYNGKPVLAALKLLRILSLQSSDISHTLVSQYEVLRPVAEYISSGVEGTYGLRIQIEAMCILSNLLNFSIGKECAVSLLPIIVTSLYKHVQGTDMLVHTSIISVTHAAVILQLVNKILCCRMSNFDEYKHQIYPLLKDGIKKWLLQLSQALSYTCGHLRLLSAALDCCRIIVHLERVDIKFLNEALLMLSSSQGFLELIQHLIPCSNLLSGIEDTDLLSVKNLMNLKSSVIDSAHKVLPILKIVSPIPFLASLFKLLETIGNIKLSTLYRDKIINYMNKIITKVPSLCDNWFTRMEVDFVFSAVKIWMVTELTESFKDTLYQVANKLCYILRVDKRQELDFLVINIVFNKAWFTAERLISLMSVSDASAFTKTLTAIDDIRMCYAGVVHSGYIDTGPNIVLRSWREPILPRDWIYLPILQLYSKSQEFNKTRKVESSLVNKVKAKETEFIVTCCLEWIVFNELCFPDLLQDIALTDRFCRIMCVFLCDNSIFLDSNIKPILKKCIQILFKKEKQQPFDFGKPLVGLHNFQDFYTQFLEQFQAVSYGDCTFASCVLVPLAQRHDVKWRKLLWSEYAGCLVALDCPQELLCYEMEEYLYPKETDESLLKCYSRALSNHLLREHTIAHRIALHHVQ